MSRSCRLVSSNAQIIHVSLSGTTGGKAAYDYDCSGPITDVNRLGPHLSKPTTIPLITQRTQSRDLQFHLRLLETSMRRAAALLAFVAVTTARGIESGNPGCKYLSTPLSKTHLVLTAGLCSSSLWHTWMYCCIRILQL